MHFGISEGTEFSFLRYVIYKKHLLIHTFDRSAFPAK